MSLHLFIFGCYSCIVISWRSAILCISDAVGEITWLSQKIKSAIVVTYPHKISLYRCFICFSIMKHLVQRYKCWIKCGSGMSAWRFWIMVLIDHYVNSKVLDFIAPSKTCIYTFYEKLLKFYPLLFLQKCPATSVSVGCLFYLPIMYC